MDLSSFFTKMADAVREKSGQTEKIRASDLPEIIRNLSTREVTSVSGEGYAGYYGGQIGPNGSLTWEVTGFEIGTSGNIVVKIRATGKDTTSGVSKSVNGTVTINY